MNGLEDAIRAMVAEEVAAAELRILAALPKYVENRTLDVREAAEILGVSEKLIYRMCQEGSIPHERFGITGSKKPAIKFRLSELETWRAEQRAANYKKGG